jgi:hypothetical protein
MVLALSIWAVAAVVVAPVVGRAIRYSRHVAREADERARLQDLQERLAARQKRRGAVG